MESVDYIGFDGGELFKEKFEEFANKPQYTQIYGSAWTDDGKNVIIQFTRIYVYTDEDWAKYVAYCGYDVADVNGTAELSNAIMSACINYGDPSSTFIHLNVRVPKGKISSFFEKNSTLLLVTYFSPH